MFRGVKINGIDTYEEYGLMLLAGVVIGSPQLKETRKEIPGRSGSLNLSYAVTGRPTYKDRPITFELFKSVDDTALDALRTKVRGLYHGREVTLEFPFDKSHYYTGVIQFGDASGYNSGRIPVSMTAFPYKYENEASTDDWLWDSFNFETDIARQYVSLPVEGTAAYTIIGSIMPISPVFDVTSADGSGLDVSINGVSFHLPEGRSSVLGLMLDDADYIFTFTGTGTVTIEFRGGKL